MAHIIFLGTGNAFVPPVRLPGGGIDCAWQSNLLLMIDPVGRGPGKKILLDCGSDIRFSLSEQGFLPEDIDGVYISHVHADHVGGLEWLAFNTYFNPKKAKPVLYCAQDTLWELRVSVEAGLSPITGVGKVTLEDFFKIEVLVQDRACTLGDHVFVNIVPATHVPVTAGQLSSFDKVSYGLRLYNRWSERTVFWTSDTIFEPTRFTSHYEAADIILQDCELGFKTGVHAHLDDLRTLDSDIKKKMLLYHLNPALILESGVADGEFAGFALKSQFVQF